jgi:HD-GYP domain-containing protein (c-di-GMP phosphodiesterase class II)
LSGGETPASGDGKSADAPGETPPATAPLRAADVYSDAVNAARSLYQSLIQSDELAGPTTVPLATLDQLVRLAVEGDPELLGLVDRCASDHHVYTHIVNVTILALRLGAQIGLPPEDLTILAQAAFLHDIGMASHLELAQKPTALTDDEQRLLYAHTTEGIKRLDRFTELTGKSRTIVRTVLGQVHERRRGGGYPCGLEGDEIHPFAQLLSLCDAYEAMTHPRPFRERVIPHEAMRRLVEEHEDEFDAAHVGALLEVFSLYPPASFVKLNTGDVARVVGVNPGLPTRPKVRLLMDAQGHRIPGKKTINLSAKPGLYIAEAVDETKLRTPDARLAVELRAQRWWVKGL